MSVFTNSGFVGMGVSPRFAVPFPRVPRTAPVRTILLWLIAALFAAADCPAQDRTALRPRTEAAPRFVPPPPHAEAFEFALPDVIGPPRPVAALAPRLPDAAALAELLRHDAGTLRSEPLPAAALRAGLASADPAVADGCGLLLGLSGPPGAERALHDAVLDRAKRGDDATGCVLGLMAAGGGPAIDWLGKLCVLPRCPPGFSLSVLRAADAAVREPALGVGPDRLHALAARLLEAPAVADAAADTLARWAAWEHAAAVIDAALAEDDPDPNRGRSLRIAAARFALACAADPAAGHAGRLCGDWIAELRRDDPDLLRRAELTRR